MPSGDRLPIRGAHAPLRPQCCHLLGVRPVAVQPRTVAHLLRRDGAHVEPAAVAEVRHAHRAVAPLRTPGHAAAQHQPAV